MSTVNDRTMKLMLRAVTCSFALVILTAGSVSADQPQAIPNKLIPIDVSGFNSGIHHWRNLRDEKRFDQVVTDPDAKPIWARHYEIGSDRPIFAGRDAIKQYALADIERERRTGTPWYGTWPVSLLRPDRP